MLGRMKEKGLSLITVLAYILVPPPTAFSNTKLAPQGSKKQHEIGATGSLKPLHFKHGLITSVWAFPK